MKGLVTLAKTKLCACSDTPKPINQFYFAHGRPVSQCKECLKAKNNARYHANPEPTKRSCRRTRVKLRLEMIEAYGGYCACCGQTKKEWLTLDHIYGGGSKDRVTSGLKGSLVRRVKSEGYPKDKYQLLCFNCNCTKDHKPLQEL